VISRRDDNTEHLLTANTAVLSPRAESRIMKIPSSPCNVLYNEFRSANEFREDLAMSHGLRSFVLSIPRPFAMAVLVPVFAAITTAILLGLLGVFVVWLCIVAVLVSAIVATDIVHRLIRRLAPAPIGALERRAVGIPGR